MDQDEEVQADAPEQETPVEDVEVDEVEETEVEQDPEPEAPIEPEKEEVDWKERALKAESVIEARKRKEKEQREKPAAPQPASSNIDSEVVLARLESRGVRESEDQQYVLRYARVEKKHPVDVLDDDVVIDRLAKNKKQREQKAASTTPSNRTGAPSSKGVDYYIKNNLMPKDPAMADKVQEELARRAKAGA